MGLWVSDLVGHQCFSLSYVSQLRSAGDRDIRPLRFVASHFMALTARAIREVSRWLWHDRKPLVRFFAWYYVAITILIVSSPHRTWRQVSYEVFGCNPV